MSVAPTLFSKTEERQLQELKDKRSGAYFTLFMRQPDYSKCVKKTMRHKPLSFVLD